MSDLLDLNEGENALQNVQLVQVKFESHGDVSARGEKSKIFLRGKNATHKSGKSCSIVKDT